MFSLKPKKFSCNFNNILIYFIVHSVYLFNLFIQFIYSIYLFNLFIQFIYSIYLFNLFQFIYSIYLFNLFNLFNFFLIINSNIIRKTVWYRIHQRNLPKRGLKEQIYMSDRAKLIEDDSY